MDDATIEWPQVLGALVAGEDLTEARAAEVMTAVMRGDAEPPVIAALLVGLRAKGESDEEIAGFVRAMVDAAEPIDVDARLADQLVDIVGTGGDRAGTFNISTIAAVVVAACGLPVAKHGNRAASGRCGSADLLEAWGVAIELPPEAVARCIEELGIGFLFARTFHPAMRVVAPIRQQLGIPTTFNILGPLSNPADAPHQAVGVADERLAPVMAGALARLGRRRALVFRGEDGLDEITTTGPSRMWEVRDGRVHEQGLDPAALGIPRAQPSDLLGGGPEENVALADRILGGEQGPQADIVAVNAAAGLYVAGAVDDLEAGIARAREVLANGEARRLRDRWVVRSRELAQTS